MALGTAKMCTLSFKSTKSCISMGNLSTSRLPIRRTEALWILLVGMCKIVYMPPFPSRTMKVHHHWAQESVLCKHSPSYELSMNVENVSTTSLLAIARSLTLSSSRQHVGHRIVLPNHMMNLKVMWFNIGYPSQRGYIWSWASRKYPEDRMTICLN